MAIIRVSALMVETKDFHLTLGQIIRVSPLDFIYMAIQGINKQTQHFYILNLSSARQGRSSTVEYVLLRLLKVVRCKCYIPLLGQNYGRGGFIFIYSCLQKNETNPHLMQNCIFISLHLNMSMFRNNQTNQKQHKANELISQIFKPQNYSLQNSLLILDKLGGILEAQLTTQKLAIGGGFLATIPLTMRNGAKSLDLIALLSEKIFSKNHSFNFLFYLLTLRICVKLLLFRDEVRGLKPLGEQTFTLRITAELISYFLLICMVLLKAKVSVEYHKMDQDERKYKNETIIVKRDGQKQRVCQEDLMVGDIMVVQANSMVRIDGIVVKSRNLSVSQAHTILREDIKEKKQIWTLNSSDERSSDPFILAGSYVIGGSGQILVCTVGPKCSFRIDNENKGYYSEYTPTIAQLKKNMNYLESIMKFIVLLLATYISCVYLLTKYLDTNTKMNWIDLLYILKVYCGYIGLICLIQRLKIIKSLQFFIEANRSEKEYRIKNRASLQQLSKLDILFVESTTVAMNKVQERGSLKIYLQHLSEISEINKFCQIKIISEEDRTHIGEIFGRDINPSCIFEPNEDIPYSSHVKSLVEATFLTKTSVSTFVNDYMPIYRALKYEIGYLYDSASEASKEVGSEVLQISFQKLAMGSLMEQPLSDTYENSRSNSCQFPFWIKIQNKIYMENILYRLFMKSHMYAQLFNVYMTLYVNNALILIVMCYFSTFVNVINLSWYLLVIIISRYMFFTIYKRINQSTNNRDMLTAKQMNWFHFVKLNMVLLPYYFYVASRVKSISSLFLFFFVNGMLRVEIILFQKRPFSKIDLFKNLAKYMGVYILVHILVILLEWDEAKFYSEEFNIVKHTLGLFGIFIAYALFI